MSNESNGQPGRITVSLEDFLRVVVAEREKFPTAEAAAAELGMTVGSFRQRLTRERKRYKDTPVFEGVPHYTGSNGPRVAEADEAMAILARLRGEETQAEETETEASE